MTTFVSDPRTLTKEKLKSELSKNSIPLPTRDSRKDVYVKLYREHLSPRKSHVDLNSLSSDEEEFGDGSPRRKKKQSNIIRRSNTMDNPQSVTDVTQLSDDELFKMLKKMGVEVGPILDTTRSVYQKKLRDLLFGGGEKKNDVEEEEMDYSDQEEEEEGTQILEEQDYAELERQNNINLRQRAAAPIQEKVTTTRTMKETTVLSNQGNKTETYETEKYTRQADGQREERMTETTTVDGKTVSKVTTSGASTKKKGMALWVQVCIFAAVALVIFIIIAMMEPSFSNPVGISGK